MNENIRLFRAVMHMHTDGIDALPDRCKAELDSFQLQTLEVAIRNAWDGIEGIVGLFGWEEPGTYAYCYALEEFKAREKEAIYLMEQDPVMGRYLGQREQFDTDWANGEYAPPGAITFDAEDLEILEELAYVDGMDGLPERKCRVCGCTDIAACPGGCYWVEEDLCSACVGKMLETSNRDGRAYD